MKILRISLCNIASLQGLHTVDFTREPLRSAGLFSISGPTGAGKSSLLDALCLALYDATPRLQPVGRMAELYNGEKQNDPRNLLRRGAADGFAEVAFVGVDKELWTARWSVRRSHRKTEGTLQNVEMTLYRGHLMPGGEGVVEEGGRKNSVLKRIAEKVGLTFEQFTRAVLLAQNDFATFLKSEDKERAEILQALTGTEHFESISRAVYQRCSEEKQKIEHLRAKLQGNPPLSAEERSAAEAANDAAAADRADLENRLLILKSQAAWFRQHKELLDARQQAERLRDQAIAAQKESIPRLQELELSETVSREVRPLHDAVQLAQESVQRLANAHDAAVKQHEVCMEVLRAAHESLTATLQHCQQLIDDQLRLQPQLLRARELDTKLEIQTTRLNQASEAMTQAEASASSLAEKLKAAQTKKAQLADEQQLLLKEHRRWSAWKPAAADAARWLDRVDAVIEASRQLDAAHSVLEKTSREVHESERLLSEEHVRLNAQKNALDELNRAVDAAVAAEKRFGIDKLVVVRSQLSQTENILTRQQLLLNQLQNHEQQKLSIQEKLDQLQLEQKRDVGKLQEIVETLQPAAQQAFRAARQQLQFIEAAVDAQVELLRNNLQSGKECPVCGSTDHPWRHYQPKLELTAVSAARTSVADLERQYQDINDQGIRLKAAIENREVQLRDREAELLRNQQDSERLTREFPDHPEAVAIIRLPETVRMKSLSDRLKQVSAELQDVEATEREHRAAQRAVESTQQQLTDARQQLTLLEENIRKQELQFQGIRDQNRIAEQTHAHALQAQDRAAGQLEELLNLLPDLKETCALDPPDFRQRLTEGTQNFIRTEKRLSELVAVIQELDAGLAPLQEASAQADRYAAESRNVRQTAADDYQLISSERSSLLGGQSAAAKEKEMLESLQRAQQSHQEATQREQAAEKQLAAAVADLNSGTKAKDAADQALTAAALALDSWCERFSVNTGRTLNLEELSRLLMRDDAWMKAERASLDRVTSELRNAEGAFQVYEQQLSQHLTLQPENTDEAAVEAAITVMQQEVASAIQKADETRAYIVSDDDRRRNNLEAARQLEQLQQQADPWLRLNDLLGSADGAKFRMIAQRRTLDVLLVYANQQLEMLATRYRLERLPESLNLVVIDRDMGDEHRSVHSLSGGESFLVSLALALGLASLTSSRLRIESLFIDEGFGSLDPETLNTAMNALLHLEAQGRKVGVISHVTEMTDAIPVQIRIVKGRGGASRIVVPGMVADLPNESVDPFVEQSSDRFRSDASRRPQKSTRKTPSDEPVQPVVTPPPFNQSVVDATAGGILSILTRELSLGRTKVSTRMLRDELGCPQDIFKAAQAQLGDRICTEGRSLKLQLP